MAVQRLLATLTWALTAGVVICVEIVLGRVLINDHNARWLFLAASAAVAAAAAIYARRLARHLHRTDKPRWRISPAEATPVLPATIGVFWLAAGVAASTYWPDWMGSGIGGCAVAVLTEYGLKRLRRRA